MSSVTQTGVYFGYAQVPDASDKDNGVLPMVMSLGYNPFYKNKQLTAVCCDFHVSCDCSEGLTVFHRKFTSCTNSNLTFMAVK